MGRRLSREAPFSLISPDTGQQETGAMPASNLVLRRAAAVRRHPDPEPAHPRGCVHAVRVSRPLGIFRQ